MAGLRASATSAHLACGRRAVSGESQVSGKLDNSKGSRETIVIAASAARITSLRNTESSVFSLTLDNADSPARLALLHELLRMTVRKGVQAVSW